MDELPKGEGPQGEAHVFQGAEDAGCKWSTLTFEVSSEFRSRGFSTLGSNLHGVSTATDLVIFASELVKANESFLIETPRPDS